MRYYPSPLEPSKVILAHELQYVVPVVAAVGFLTVIVASGGPPVAWVVAGTCWLFVALAWSWWTQRASTRWTTPFRDSDDHAQAESVVHAVLEAPGLGSLAPDVWVALSEASVLDEREGHEPNHGEFRHAVEAFQETIAAAYRNVERTGNLERTIRLMREVRAELEDRDSS